MFGVAVRGRVARSTRAGALRIVAAAIVSLAAACSGPPPAQPAGILQVDIETSPTSTDPRFATDALSSRINELIFESLVRLDARGEFQGELAETIERPSAREIVFRLRRGVRFSNGRELNARDVKFTYESVLDSQALSPKRAGLRPLESIAVSGDHTIVMTTHEPYAPALEMAMLGIVPEGSPIQSGRGADAPPGTGPFKLVSFTRDDAVALARNPFHERRARGADGVVFKVVPDPTVRALELIKGICQFTQNSIQPDLLPYLRAKPNLVVLKSPGTAYQYLAFNFRSPALLDLRVRRAIAYAIDRKSIVDSYLRGTARVATGMLAPNNWAYTADVMTYSYDPERARQLLDEAGYLAGPDGMRGLALAYKTTPEGARMAEIIQAMLKRVGINVSVRTNEWATFYGDIQRGNFELTSLQWIGINDPNHYYMVFDSRMSPPIGLNRGAYSNRAMDRLVESGSIELDPVRRREIYAQVQRLAAEDLPYVSLWWHDNVVVMSGSLEGFEPFPNGSLRSLAKVSLSRDGRATVHQ